MPAKFINVDRQSPMLLPPDLKEWVSENDLVHFIVEVCEQLDTSRACINHRGTGSAQYPPTVMLALLIYCYATSCFSSRRIERATYDSIAVRYICGNHHPDHDTIASFRRRNPELIQECFFYVLQIAREMGLLKLGTLSVDGTKLKANASARGKKTLAELEQELAETRHQIRQLLDEAEKADREDEDAVGTLIPEDLAQQQKRSDKLQKAKAALEARLAKLKENAKKAADRYKLPEKERKRPGKKPNKETEKKREQKERERQKVSLTDPDSHSVPHRKEGSIQGYNAQAGLCTKSRLIVTNNVSNNPNDCNELAPLLEKLNPQDRQSMRHIIADKGYWDSIELPALETQYECRTLSPPKNPNSTTNKAYPAHHPRKKAKLFKEKMKRRLKTHQGKSLYRQRSSVSEGGYHIIKNLLGFKEFRLRGIDGVSIEWDLISLASNIRQILRLRDSRA